MLITSKCKSSVELLYTYIPQGNPKKELQVKSCNKPTLPISKLSIVAELIIVGIPKDGVWTTEIVADCFPSEVAYILEFP